MHFSLSFSRAILLHSSTSRNIDAPTRPAARIHTRLRWFFSFIFSACLFGFQAMQLFFISFNARFKAQKVTDKHVLHYRWCRGESINSRISKNIRDRMKSIVFVKQFKIPRHGLKGGRWSTGLWTMGRYLSNTKIRGIVITEPPHYWIRLVKYYFSNLRKAKIMRVQLDRVYYSECRLSYEFLFMKYSVPHDPCLEGMNNIFTRNHMHFLYFIFFRNAFPNKCRIQAASSKSPLR